MISLSLSFSVPVGCVCLFNGWLKEYPVKRMAGGHAPRFRSPRMCDVLFVNQCGTKGRLGSMCSVRSCGWRWCCSTGSFVESSPHAVDSDIRASIPQSAYCDCHTHPYLSIGVDCENDMGDPITLIHKIDSSLEGQLRAVKR